MFHYVRKKKIAESAVMGTMVEALCGEVFPVTKAPKPGSPVCPACKEIYEDARARSSDQPCWPGSVEGSSPVSAERPLPTRAPQRLQRPRLGARAASAARAWR